MLFATQVASPKPTKTRKGRKRSSNTDGRKETESMVMRENTSLQSEMEDKMRGRGSTENPVKTEMSTIKGMALMFTGIIHR